MRAGKTLNLPRLLAELRRRRVFHVVAHEITNVRAFELYLRARQAI